ncbi:MAG: PhzF family phenazine biosynthesis protein [Candidatus Thorarchaeota archaeon]|jgi:trans-2,3-dihydro-3-hydroxyanthranilate isomerase
MISLPYVQTTVFVDNRHRFGGNQLATFYDTSLNSRLNDSEMQGIAREMNFSETTFIIKSKRVQSGYGVRIFTPYVELPIAGHPTLGSAFVLKNRNLIPSHVAATEVELQVGPTEVEFNLDNISMTQPYPDFIDEYDSSPKLADALGLVKEDFSTHSPNQVLSCGAPFMIVPLMSIDAVRKTVPRELQILEILREMKSNGVVVFCTETVHSDSNLHARMFAPGLGVAEDPATGSAAGPLGAYAEEYGVIQNHDLGTTILIEQGHEIDRPSLLRSSVVRSGKPHVKVAGVVRMTAEGLFFLHQDEETGSTS